MDASVFPGQGSQFSGMGKEEYLNNKKVAAIFDSANEILGFKLSEIMFEGENDILKSTEIAQLAVFVHSYALTKAMQSFRPQGVAGHSLGEYTALAVIECLSFEDSLNIINERAKAMKEATILNPGKMAAVLGLSNEKVEEICENIENVWLANYNCPGQIVISGSNDGIQKACEELNNKGAKKIIELKVSGAFHTQMMEPAKLKLSNFLKNIKINKPTIPIYQNVDAKSTTDPKIIKQNLIEQITSPVKWTQTIQNMIKNGFNHFGRNWTR